MAFISLSRILQYWSDRQPDRVAITHDDDALTWRQLDQASNAMARAYASLGVEQDNLVTIALPNSLAFFVSVFAVWKLGATPQPVSAKMPVAEIRAIIGLAESALVVGVHEADYPGFKSVPMDYVPAPGTDDSPLTEKSARYFKAMTSGGSTGRPKLIVSHIPAYWDPDMEYLNFPVAGSMLVPGPLYHNGVFMWAMIGLFKGNQVAIQTRFDAENTLALIERHRVEVMYSVPTMLQRIWNLPEATRNRYDLSSLKVLWHLAAPCPPWLKRAYIEWLGPERIWELYAGTEGTGATVINGAEWLAHPGSVGRAVAGSEIVVLDDAGTVLPVGEVGEVYIRPEGGQGSTYHYVGAEAKGTSDGFESLGDMGYVDAEGFLYLTDRRTDMILSGGANIYPAEVEAAIDAYPGVRSSAVIGLPHEDMGNAVHAIIDRPEGPVAAEVLDAFLREHLVSYKLPRSIEFVDEPLRDDAGKVRRTALRAARLTH